MNWKNVLYTFLAIVCIFFTFYFYDRYKEAQIEKEVQEKVALQLELSDLKNKNILLIEDNTLLKTQKDYYLQVIDQQEKDIEKINKKYEKNRIIIDKLTNSESFDLFTRNAEKYKNK